MLDTRKYARWMHTRLKKNASVKKNYDVMNMKEIFKY